MILMFSRRLHQPEVMELATFYPSRYACAVYYFDFWEKLVTFKWNFGLIILCFVNASIFNA